VSAVGWMGGSVAKLAQAAERVRAQSGVYILLAGQRQLGRTGDGAKDGC
jgi:hypothetical protein